MWSGGFFLSKSPLVWTLSLELRTPCADRSSPPWRLAPQQESEDQSKFDEHLRNDEHQRKQQWNDLPTVGSWGWESIYSVTTALYLDLGVCYLQCPAAGHLLVNIVRMIFLVLSRKWVPRGNQQQGSQLCLYFRKLLCSPLPWLALIIFSRFCFHPSVFNL